MEALLQELDADAARAAAKQDTRRARRKGLCLPHVLQVQPPPPPPPPILPSLISSRVGLNVQMLSA